MPRSVGSSALWKRWKLANRSGIHAWLTNTTLFFDSQQSKTNTGDQSSLINKNTNPWTSNWNLIRYPIHWSNPTSISISSISSIFNSLRSGSFASRSFNSSTRVSSLKLAAGAGRSRLLGTCSCRNLTWKHQSTIKHDNIIDKTLVATGNGQCLFSRYWTLIQTPFNKAVEHGMVKFTTAVAGSPFSIILCSATIPTWDASSP